MFVIALTLGWLPALLLLLPMWPGDFIGRPDPVQLSFDSNSLRMEFIQWPDVDFYSSWMRVAKENGATGCFPIDSDDDKWWFPVIRKEGGVVVLYTWYGFSNVVTFDESSHILVHGNHARQVDLKELSSGVQDDCYPGPRS